MIDALQIDSRPLEWKQAGARARFLAELNDERAFAAWDREMRRENRLERFRCVRATFDAHNRAHAAAVAAGVPKGKRLIPAIPGESPRRIGGDFLHDGERIRIVGDSDETLPVPIRSAKAVAERRRFQDAEREFIRHAKSETGHGVSPEQYAEQQMDRAEVRAQSHKLAEMLESAGKSAYRNEAFSLWAYFVHSKHWEAIPNFRRICLLPYVAAMVRASKLAALEYFLQRNPFARFWTFTSGGRVGIAGLRERCQWLSRRLSKLNAMLRERFGVEIVFRSTEFGTLECDESGNRSGDSGTVEFDEKGEPLFHVHAHCVIVSRVGFIHPKKWREMVTAVWDFWGYHWDAGKMIRNARECCKYVTKPGDMLKLSPEQLGRLHEAIFRLKLCQPLGILADEIRNRKRPEVGKTLRRYRTPDGCVWREVFDHNRHAEIDEEDRWAAEDLRDAQRMAVETAAAARVKPGVAPSVPGTDAPWCAVFARLSPSIGPAGRKEPRVIVGGTHRDAALVVNHPLVFRLWAETVQAWEDRAAKPVDPIRVHTGTPTVRDVRPFGFVADIPERMRPPGPPVWEPEIAEISNS